MKNKELIERVNTVIKNEKMRTGLWHDKYTILNMKMRENCKRENSSYTEGGWKNRKSCSTKSQWTWRSEKEMLENLRSPLEKPRKITAHIKYGRKAVILFDEKNKIAEVYDAELERNGTTYIVKIIVGRNRIRVIGKNNILEKDICEKVIAAGEEITIKDLIKVSLEKDAEIITIVSVEMREE